MDDRFEVAVAAGMLMSESPATARFPHRWTPEGVTVEADFTGRHLLSLAAAGCVPLRQRREEHAEVDEVAEIPRAIRAGAPVRRVPES
jgi:hypothetical protein